MGKFSIHLFGDRNSKIRISKRILQYFENFVLKKILEPKKIILNAKFDIDISFMLSSDYKENKEENIVLYHYRQTYDVKSYPISIPVDRIKESNNINIKSALLFYEGITLFFISNYKKISKEFMNDLIEEIDWDYLASLPYPAHLKDIDYAGENYMSLSKGMGWQ